MYSSLSLSLSLSIGLMLVTIKDLDVVRDQLLAPGIYVPSFQSSWHLLWQGIDVRQAQQ
jgi:hypothetical protein